MTLTEFYTVLTSTGLPVAYLEFEEESCPDMPFLIYEEVGKHNFGADNKVYSSAKQIQVDLFTERKDPESEALLENALNNADIYFDCSSAPDDSEHCYRMIYTMEV